MKYFPFDVELFLTKWDSLLVHLQSGIVIFLKKIVMMVYGSFLCVKVGEEMLLKL